MSKREDIEAVIVEEPEMGVHPQAFKKMFHLKSLGALFAALVKGGLRVSSAYVNQGRYADVDTGLATMARHAKSLATTVSSYTWTSSSYGWCTASQLKQTANARSSDGRRGERLRTSEWLMHLDSAGGSAARGWVISSAHEYSTA